ncbi:MAG: hypothetical protein K9L85_00445 [Candidatus Peribacteraceae bacterium]|nr:hypothetical protein [Candidatus Peribacteraceae bacterium]
MITGRNYQNSERRRIFRLRDPELHPQKDFDPTVKFPPRYPDLDEEQKMHVAEFIDFIFANRKAVENDDDLHFYIRDHENRPATTQLPIPDKIPTGYEKLNSKERQHLFEFISFLLKKAGK